MSGLPRAIPVAFAFPPSPAACAPSPLLRMKSSAGRIRFSRMMSKYASASFLRAEPASCVLVRGQFAECLDPRHAPTVAVFASA